MKRFLLITAIITGISYYLPLNAQISQEGIPFGFTAGLSLNDVDRVSLPVPDLQKIQAEDIDRALKSAPYRMGVSIPFYGNPKNSGTWTDLPDGSGKLWRLSISAAGASALGLYFSDFYLPSAYTLFVYNPDMSKILGAYTTQNNSDHRGFAIEMVEGEEVILELFVPEGSGNDYSLQLSEVAYFYRGVRSASKGADVCEVNINCPEGAGWQDEKQGVCRISIKNGGYFYYCTGSLLNNVRQDCKGYVLLADHCTYDGGYASASDLNNWIFYFHYEATSCSGTTPSGTRTLTGCTLKAHDTYGSNNHGSDFYLVQLGSTIPSSWSLYYNGWDRSGNVVTGGVGIHHPQGDIKKISTFTSSLVSASMGGTGTHWKVVWAPTTTDHGVTEEGSSGSPLFGNVGNVVGTLTGGGSYCTDPYAPDYYGKFSYHWISNGSSNDKQLKPWLDPDNTNTTVLPGTYVCGGGIADSYYSEKNISIFPNPAQDEIVISTGNQGEQMFDHIIIYNTLGSVVKSVGTQRAAGGSLKINIGNLENGIYYLVALSESNLFRGEFIVNK